MRVFRCVLALALLFAACSSKTPAPEPAPVPKPAPTATTGSEHEPAAKAPAPEPGVEPDDEPADVAPAAEADTVAPAPEDTTTPAAAAPADPRPAASDPTCMPAWYGEADYGRRPKLTLSRVGDAVVLCAVDQDHERLVGTLGCWAVDPATGGLSAHAAISPPGQGHLAKVTDGCVEGLCAEGLEGETALVATNIDGTRAVVLGDREPRFHVFDTATKKEIKAFVNSPVDGEADDKAISNEPIEIYFVGQRIYVLGTDAGPWMGVWRFADHGMRLGPIKEGEALASLYGGSLSVLDDGHVGASLRGLDSLIILDVTGGEPVSVRRATPKSPCSAEELDLMGDGAEEGPCAEHIARVFYPWSDAQLVSLPSGGYLAVQTSGELVTLDAKLAETKRFPAPYCK